MILVKVCGITTLPALNTSIKGGASYVGFMFYPPSPRNITPQDAAILAAHIPPSVKKVAVTVNADDQQLADIQSVFIPDFWQLHGNESPERAQQIKQLTGIPIIKACSIRNGDDIAASLAYQDSVDMLLFDARPPKEMTNALPGGNGLSFDWNLLANRTFSLPWMLAGGINADNVIQAITASGASMVDVSSSLENSPGIKSPELIETFLQKV